MDTLKATVREYDRQRNTERQMRVTERPISHRRICKECRRLPDYAAYRAAWLKDNPTPAKRPADFPLSRYEQFGEARWVAFKMPTFELQTECQWCGGRLVEVSW